MRRREPRRCSTRSPRRGSRRPSMPRTPTPSASFCIHSLWCRRSPDEPPRHTAPWRGYAPRRSGTVCDPCSCVPRASSGCWSSRKGRSTRRSSRSPRRAGCSTRWGSRTRAHSRCFATRSRRLPAQATMTAPGSCSTGSSDRWRRSRAPPLAREPCGREASSSSRRRYGRILSSRGCSRTVRSARVPARRGAPRCAGVARSSGGPARARSRRARSRDHAHCGARQRRARTGSPGRRRA